ncbi:uncharacterized protein UV8b_06988 [Ustilaginoidea virens]|uniref:Hydrophobin n=1 Tax=Ustilaginoidea virens TaxID=1159556 RepID=A0A8E5MKJ3_USTVR|nr:uncharacterized protein UV8b_06988 [Ustilaginoidea virens]QUC22747.1 hypothetical protein UV8b_06988 [Ustilaginoidea virens]
MKFALATVLALATAALAAPTESSPSQCKHLVCTDSSLLVLDLDVQVDVDVLGLIDIDVDLDLQVDLLKHHRKCKAVYCCPSKCEQGKHIPDSCHRYD